MKQGIDMDNMSARTTDPDTSRVFVRSVDVNETALQFLRRIADAGPKGTTYHSVCDPRYCTLITKLIRAGFVEVIGRSKQPLGRIYAATEAGRQVIA